MNGVELVRRTRQLGISCGKIIQALPNNTINRAYSNQLIRCSSSVGANYRAARRAKSKPDFINKLKIVEEELDESLFFLGLIEEFNPSFKSPINAVILEGEILLRIFVATLKTLRQ